MPQPVEPASNGSGPEGEPPYAEWAEGGDYFRIHRPTGNHGKRPPRLVPTPGTAHFDEEYGCFRAEWKRAKRSAVGAFNAGMRRRMLQLNAKVNVQAIGELALFLTLTYPGEWLEDWVDWKRHLAAFKKRFERRYGKYAAYWRLERQKRGAPHFHLIVFMPEAPLFHPQFKKWLSRVWYEIVGSGDIRHMRAGTQSKRLNTAREVVGYCAKYLSKEDDHPSEIGRRWGIWNKKLLPIVMHRAALRRAEFMKLRRALATYLRKKGYPRKLLSAYAGVVVFLGNRDAARLLAWATGSSP